MEFSDFFFQLLQGVGTWSKWDILLQLLDCTLSTTTSLLQWRFNPSRVLSTLGECNLAKKTWKDVLGHPASGSWSPALPSPSTERDGESGCRLQQQWRKGLAFGKRSLSDTWSWPAVTATGFQPKETESFAGWNRRVWNIVLMFGLGTPSGQQEVRDHMLKPPRCLGPLRQRSGWQRLIPEIFRFWFKNLHLWDPCGVPGTGLEALHVLYLIFPATLHSRCYYPHFRTEEAEVSAMIFFMALGPANRAQLEES